MGYSSDEEKLIKAFRKLTKGQQRNLLDSFKVFVRWIKDELYDIFIRIGDKIRDFFYDLASLFG